MRPPIVKASIPTVANPAKKRLPLFYTAQPKFSIATPSMSKAKVHSLTPFNLIPQHNHGNMSLPIRSINQLRLPHSRGVGEHFDISTVAARPPRWNGLSYDPNRKNYKCGMNNYDPKQKGLLKGTP